MYKKVLPAMSEEWEDFSIVVLRYIKTLASVLKQIKQNGSILSKFCIWTKKKICMKILNLTYEM